MTEIDLALGVLDHQLVDSEGRRCGKVDDLELAGLGEGMPQVTEILVSAPAWRGRGRLGRKAAALGVRSKDTVAWDDVVRVDRRGMVVRDEAGKRE